MSTRRSRIAVCPDDSREDARGVSRGTMVMLLAVLSVAATHSVAARDGTPRPNERQTETRTAARDAATTHKERPTQTVSVAREGTAPPKWHRVEAAAAGNASWIAAGKKSCLGLPLDECKTRGCDVLLAHPYDARADCYVPEVRPAFCRATPDIQCVWKGHPVILRQPGGKSWYVKSSCFKIPDGWTRIEVPGGKPVCSAN